MITYGWKHPLSLGQKWTKTLESIVTSNSAPVAGLGYYMCSTPAVADFCLITAWAVLIDYLMQVRGWFCSFPFAISRLSSALYLRSLSSLPCCAIRVGRRKPEDYHLAATRMRCACGISKVDFNFWQPWKWRISYNLSASQPVILSSHINWNWICVIKLQTKTVL